MIIIKSKVASEKLLVFAALLTRVGSNVALFFALALLVSDREFGELLLFFTISTILACIIEFGLSTFILSKSNHSPIELRELYCTIQSSRIFLAFPALAIYLLIVYLWPLPEAQAWSLSTPAKVSIFLACVFFTNAQTAETVLRAAGKVKNELISASIGNAVFLICVIGSAFYFKQIDAIAFAMALGRAIHLTQSTLQTRRIAPLASKSRQKVNKLQFLKTNRHFALQAVAATAYLQVDSIIIGYLLGPEPVGNYQLFFRIVLGLGIVADASASVKLKQIAGATGYKNQKSNHNNDKEKLLAVSVATIAAIMMFSLVIALNHNYVLSKPSSLFAENSFSLIEHCFLAAILSTLVFVRFLAAHLGVELTARSMQRVRSNGAVGALAIIVILCFIAIPFAGLPGAAFANLCGNIFIVSFYTKALR